MNPATSVRPSGNTPTIRCVLASHSFLQQIQPEQKANPISNLQGSFWRALGNESNNQAQRPAHPKTIAAATIPGAGGLQHREDPDRFLADLRELSEFGRYAAGRRAKRGEGKPTPFNSPGFTHICWEKSPDR
jgi:hypothetical protein